MINYFVQIERLTIKKITLSTYLIDGKDLTIALLNLLQLPQEVPADVHGEMQPSKTLKFGIKSNPKAKDGNHNNH